MPGRENAKEQILHWMQCEERHLNIPAYYNILSNAALLGGGGDGMRGLSGRRPVHTYGSGALLSSDHSGTCHEECGFMEEEPSVFSGGVSFHTDDTGAVNGDGKVELTDSSIAETYSGMGVTKTRSE